MDRSHEFEPTTNWLVRACHTPLSDALRGRLTGRFDVRREIAAADLPAPVGRLIYSVVRRTRLSRHEKLDVAGELVAHFLDGLAAGRSPESLVEQFGSPKQAAKLIRQAKRRNRPLYWQAWWYVSRGLVAAMGISVIGYALLAARFYLAHPTIAHNYWNDINAARAVPEDQRAWPLYRTALIKLGKEDSGFLTDHWRAEPGDKDWGELEDLVSRHRESIELAREAAAKPHLGYLLGDPADREFNVAWNADRNAPLADDNRILIAVRLEGLIALRPVGRLLYADARYAASKGDGETAVADLSALISLSEQVFQPDSVLVEQLIGLAIFGVACEATGRILIEHPSAVSDDQWRDLAHEFAAYRDGQIAIDFTGEKIVFDDVLQRSFTDDGQGNGRLTQEGIKNLYYLGTGLGPLKEAENLAVELTEPGVAALIGSRADNREFFNSTIDEGVAARQGPTWQWDYDTVEEAYERFETAIESPFGRLRYIHVALICPAVGPAVAAAEAATLRRDAAEVAIALELWRRRHGDWPASLEQLVPDLLPAVPPDRYDGRPLRYVVRDGRPLLYSIGSDRSDGGGTPPDHFAGAMGGFDPVNPKRQSSEDGDWILWPPPNEPEQEGEVE